MSSILGIPLLKSLVSTFGLNIEFFGNVTKLMVLSVVYYLFYKQLPFLNRTKLLFKKTEKNEEIAKCLKKLSYRPTIYLPGLTTQLIYHELAPSKIVKFVREYIHTEDGGIISLDWVIDSGKSFNKILIILPGLSGGSEANYIRDIVLGFLKVGGYKVVIMHNRGISDTPVLTPMSFHAAKTDDLKLSIEVVRKRYGGYPCFGLGVSFGANIFTKLLANDEDIGSYMKGFVSISNPLNLHESEKITRNTFIGFFLYKALKTYAERHSIFRTNQDLQFEILNEIKTCKDFDDNFTCKLHGFKDANEYYLTTSSGPDIGKLKVPTLFINAKDDILAPIYAVDLKPCKSEN
jgi:predicted alpha/beta-fold hydrolase